MSANADSQSSDRLDFTCAGYAILIRELQDLGYSAVDFQDVKPAAAEVILRHDIDLWPEAALKIARVEASLGVSSWYFVWPTGPLYSIDTQTTVATLKEIIALGHRIGLHFDASPHGADLDILSDAAAWECSEIEQRLNIEVEMVSFHRPVPELLGCDQAIAGRMHSYQPKFFDQIGYCSDSRGLWSHGHPLAQDAVLARRALQLLTHPIWWANDNAGDRERALHHLVKARGEHCRAAIATIITGYDPVSGKISDDRAEIK